MKGVYLIFILILSVYAKHRKGGKRHKKPSFGNEKMLNKAHEEIELSSECQKAADKLKETCDTSKKMKAAFKYLMTRMALNSEKFEKPKKDEKLKKNQNFEIKDFPPQQNDQKPFKSGKNKGPKNSKKDKTGKKKNKSTKN